jgi:hypothetical protein
LDEMRAVMKRSKSLILLLILTLLSVPFPANAAEARTVELRPISGKEAGEQVTVAGTTTLDAVTIKVLRPNQTVLYLNVRSGGEFADSFTLPGDASPGTYTVVAGGGDISSVVRFRVTEKTGGNPSSPEQDGGGTGPHTLPAAGPVAVENGFAVVAFGAGKSSAAAAVKDIGGLPLRVHAHQVTVTVDQTEIQSLLARAGITAGAVLLIEVEPVTNPPSSGPLRQGAATLTAVGQAYEIRLSLLTADGKEYESEELTGVIEIVLPYNPAGADSALLGIYRLNEASKEWEYAGGTVDSKSSKASARLSHLSRYAVMEYRQAFADMPAGHWAARPVEVLAAKHAITGTAESQFSPNGKTTRAEFAAMLVRVLGLEPDGRGMPFRDVPAGAWYADEIAAAYAAGLASGVSAAEFRPNAPVTREQMAVMLVNAYEYKQGKYEAAEDRLPQNFRDGEQVSSWAANAVNKAVNASLMQGVGRERFDPRAAAVRAQTAQAIYNLAAKLDLF